MYDQPLLLAYEKALQFNGSPLSLLGEPRSPTAAGAPAFPEPGSPPPGFTLPVQSLATVDPDFQVGAHLAEQRAVRARLRQRLLGDRSGYTYAKSSDLPVVTDVNLINPVGTLADGRPIYGTAVSAATRVDPRFNHIYLVQSVGLGDYNALTLQLSRRLRAGATFNMPYTLAKGEDNAPLQRAVSGTSGLGVVSDSSARSDEPRPRQGAEPARHAPQLHRQHRVPADGAATRAAS